MYLLAENNTTVIALIVVLFNIQNDKYLSVLISTPEDGMTDDIALQLVKLIDCITS